MQLSSPLKGTIQSIPDGPAGTLATLKIMRRLVRRGKVSMPVRQLALSIVRRNQQKDFNSEIRDIHAFVRDKIRYVKDVRGVETLHTPERIIEMKQGDCDDKSILTAALLESIGHRTRLVAVGFMLGTFAHVYVEVAVKINGKERWAGLETTEPVNVGWRPSRVVEKMTIYN